MDLSKTQNKTNTNCLRLQIMTSDNIFMTKPIYVYVIYTELHNLDD